MSEVDREREEEDLPPRPSGLDPLAKSERPDWLIGADEGATEERSRVEGQPKDGPTMPGLIPLGGKKSGDGTDVPPAPRPVAHWPGRPSPTGPSEFSGMTSNDPEWFTGQAESPPAPEPVEPMAPTIVRSGDEKSGLAAVAAWVAENDSADAARTGRPSPSSKRVPPEPAKPPASRLEQLATRQNLMIAGLVAVVIIAAMIFFRPSGTATIALSRIRRDPARYDGTVVTVRGKIGEVFPMGNSYAYNLHQGRDTIVVFTRTRVPVSREKVTVVGSVSTGYLEGVPRAAIFEEKATP